MREIVVIAHDIRSTHNVGALLRTAECMGVAHVYLTGYTPYPTEANDERLPHLRDKISRQIDKTALGAGQLVAWTHHEDVYALIEELKHSRYTIVALEQTQDSIALPSWHPPEKVVILLGREVEGIDKSLLLQCDIVVEIPQFGHKESLNVVQAAAMALYQARFVPIS